MRARWDTGKLRGAHAAGPRRGRLPYPASARVRGGGPPGADRHQGDRATPRQKPRPARPQAPGCPTRYPPRPGATDPLRAGTPLPRPLPQEDLPPPSVNAHVEGLEVDAPMARAAPHRRARRVRVSPHPRLVRARPHPRRDPPARRLPRPPCNPPPARGGARRGRRRGAITARPRGPSPASFMASISWANRVAVRLGGTAARQITGGMAHLGCPGVANPPTLGESPAKCDLLGARQLDERLRGAPGGGSQSHRA